MRANCAPLSIPMISPLVALLSSIVLLRAHNSSFVGRLCLQQLRGVYFSLLLAGRDLVGMQLSRLAPRNACVLFGICAAQLSVICACFISCGISLVLCCKSRFKLLLLIELSLASVL